MKNITIILILITTLKSNAQVTVGWDASCDYDESQTAGQIQQAIDDGATEIRVTNQQTFVMPVFISNDLILKGGYNTCADASNDTQSVTKTVIDASTITPSAIKIHIDAVRDITIDNFEIQNSTSSSDQSGALTIYNTAGVITLNRLFIHDNNNVSVGGIIIYHDALMNSSPLGVNLDDILVIGNSGSITGGIQCDNTGSFGINITITGDSGISYNYSDGNGGGISLSNCELSMSSGTDSPSVTNPLGIHSNTANGVGGGLFMGSNSQAFLSGTQMHPVNITDNTADLDNVSSGSGGGLFISESMFSGSNLLIAGNESLNKDGGGIFAQLSSVSITSDARHCSWSQLCSMISNNTAKNGGAIDVTIAADVVIKTTEIKGNRAGSSGAVAYMRDDNSQITFEGNLIHHNGGMDHSEFSDFNLIHNGFGSNNTTVAYSTIVDNEAQFASISPGSGTIQLFGSIIDDPGVAAVSVLPGSTLGIADCNILGNEQSITFLPTSNNIFESVPAFVDKVNQNYHLDPLLSIGIDRCESSIYTILTDDLDGNIRGYNHPDFVNNTGLYDIGVDEVSSDFVFKDSFE